MRLMIMDITNNKMLKNVTAPFSQHLRMLWSFLTRKVEIWLKSYSVLNWKIQWRMLKMLMKNLKFQRRISWDWSVRLTIITIPSTISLKGSRFLSMDRLKSSVINWEEMLYITKSKRSTNCHLIWQFNSSVSTGRKRAHYQAQRLERLRSWEMSHSLKTLMFMSSVVLS